MPKLPWRYLTILLIANVLLLWPDASPLRITGALLLIGLLPGWSWVEWWLTSWPSLPRWIMAAGLSYILTMLATLLLHYLPGPIQTWQLVVSLTLAAILPLWRYFYPNYAKARPATPSHSDHTNEISPLFHHYYGNFLSPIWRVIQLEIKNGLMPLLLILLIALLLRGVNLGYSEFQGDESLAMISAAEALEGHEDALFLRSKGPGEVLLPMALWRLTGTINEPMARLPFALAGLWAIMTLYVLGRELKDKRVGWLAAGFFACNGFAVGFSRIVQYQILVLWLSALAFWLTWQWRQTGQNRLAALAGLCLGAGLLAHYDAVLVLPAIVWLFVTKAPALTLMSRKQNNIESAKEHEGTPGFLKIPPSRDFVSLSGFIKAGLLFLAACLLVALPFYLPYSLDPRANRTGEYIGNRVGHQLRNNLPDFFHFNTFYSSSYYLIITGLLVTGILAAWIWQARLRSTVYRLPVIILLVSIIGVILKPNLLAWDYKLDLLDWDKLDLSVLPFGLLLLTAFLVRPGGSLEQGLITWLAVPFLGYNFVVALGLTHIYTTLPAWSLLAALAWSELFYKTQPTQRADKHKFSLSPLLISNFLLTLLFILSTVFLWNAFVRHDVEYWQDYPAGNLSLYWNPYDQPPRAGLFGLAHRAGWKAVGQKIAGGELSGDFGSNEEPDVTAWYTRGAPRACDPQPEFYFLADDLIDPVDTPNDVLEANYTSIGGVTLPNGKQMRFFQQKPTTLNLGELDDAALAEAFDQSATPAAFARSARGATPLAVNFGNVAQLIGYNLDTRRAYPGGRVPVTLYWQALAPIQVSYQVFTHLEGQSGPVAQADGAPVCWTYPTDRWQPGQIIADQHAMPLAPEVLPGQYALQVGLYLADTGQRLDVLDAAGNPAGTSVTLAELKIRDEK